MYWFLVGYNSALFTRGAAQLLLVTFFLVLYQDSQFDAFGLVCGLGAGTVGVFILDSPRLVQGELLPWHQSLFPMEDYEQASSTMVTAFIVLAPIRHWAPEVLVFLAAMAAYLVLCTTSLAAPTTLAVLMVIVIAWSLIGVLFIAFFRSTKAQTLVLRLFRTHHEGIQYLVPSEFASIQQNTKYMVIWALVTLPEFGTTLLGHLALFPVLALAWMMLNHWTLGGFRLVPIWQQPSGSHLRLDRIINEGVAISLGTLLLAVALTDIVVTRTSLTYSAGILIHVASSLAVVLTVRALAPNNYLIT